MTLSLASGIVSSAGLLTQVVGHSTEADDPRELERRFDEKRMRGAAAMKTRAEELEWR